ncbi:MAG TPA: hypothetical protein VJB89_02115 [Candidatus Nanoarchaeia archaeon]|nr:hypothetical protein [Candidatus Nanoarchaeia archaeon]
MAATVLGSAIEFFKEFGLFDIILPFLLVFTVTFALLEKTMILGSEENEKGKKYPKKNLNAMVAFVIGLLVVTANKVVNAINVALPNIVFLIIIIISFLMLVGTFFKTGELDFMETYGNKAKIGFMMVVLLLVILIFLDSIPTDSGESWLEYAFNYTLNNFSGAVVTSLILLLVVIGAIALVVRGNNKGGKE